MTRLLVVVDYADAVPLGAFRSWEDFLSLPVGRGAPAVQPLEGGRFQLGSGRMCVLRTVALHGPELPAPERAPGHPVIVVQTDEHRSLVGIYSSWDAVVEACGREFTPRMPLAPDEVRRWTFGALGDLVARWERVR